MKPWRRIIGVDPGNSGGVVVLAPHRRGGDSWYVDRVFRLGGGEAAIVDFFHEVCQTGAEEVCYLEKVHGWGVARSFNFGMYYGFVRGVVMARGVSVVDVTPQAWMKEMGVEGKSQTREKRESMRLLAENVQGSVSATNWNAAAILIAMYGLKQEGGKLNERA